MNIVLLVIAVVMAIVGFVGLFRGTGAMEREFQQELGSPKRKRGGKGDSKRGVTVGA